MEVVYRSLRRKSLEDHLQEAINTVRADVIDEAVSDVMARMDTVPADMRPRAIRQARQSLADALATLDARPQAKALTTHWSAGKRKAKADPDSVFKAVEQAVAEAGEAQDQRVA